MSQDCELNPEQFTPLAVWSGSTINNMLVDLFGLKFNDFLPEKYNEDQKKVMITN